jgi:hypothetical protein
MIKRRVKAYEITKDITTIWIPIMETFPCDLGWLELPALFLRSVLITTVMAIVKKGREINNKDAMRQSSLSMFVGNVKFHAKRWRPPNRTEPIALPIMKIMREYVSSVSSLSF